MSSILSIILLIAWLVLMVKRILFWTYLWQLKEYHFKRFIDHFRTKQGKKIFLSFIFLSKLAILAYFFINRQTAVIFYYPILLIYLLELAKTGLEIAKRRILKPVITAKALFIILLSCAFIICSAIFIRLEAIGTLLLIDVFSFVIVSFFVICFWPITKIFQKRLMIKAKKIIDSKDLTVIAITGSYGKTTTKEILYAILSEKFKTLKTKEHINAEVGIAKTIINELDNQEIFIVETGAYEKGKINQVCQMVKPRMGILTGINQQHLSTFGSQENIIKAKFELIQSLPSEGIGFVNIDNEFIRKKLDEDNFVVQKLVFVGKDKKELANIWAENIIAEREKFLFTLKDKEGTAVDFAINMPGSHNVINALLAIVASHHLGIDYSEIARILGRTQFLQKAIEVKKGKSGLSIIDSSYSANSDGVMSALEYLSLWPNKRILVMPSLIELGSASKDVHFMIGQKIAEICDLAIIIKDDQFKAIQEGAVSAGMDVNRIVSISNLKEVYKKIMEFSSEGDAVLLEGRIPESFKKLILNE
ncbi:MAG: UDP-N-acetylmuramoyl-tripeptide--D-alanyl-D-alanine ligase [Candidatus Pacebacteria bacterium]|nr:UDP-N-acetylmuramoyl-tripeptide--D-alanyl-D-alanine ligase [Candidatus Paceibacterota bacterium]MDD5621169.1 UDP-N-acetylmuramoyl-tripeptide--D-alanyl-D-alanine ligase [Candidatus Paceibacterota bacterium]